MPKTAKTAEQVAAEKTAKELAAAARLQARVATKAAKAQAKLDAKAAKALARTAAKDVKEQAKAAAKAARANTQPEQNGVRRPKADGSCGKAWAIFDSISTWNPDNAVATAVTISEALVVSRAQDINDNTTRTQYAAWRKFNGISGRATVAKAAE